MSMLFWWFTYLSWFWWFVALSLLPTWLLLFLVLIMLTVLLLFLKGLNVSGVMRRRRITTITLAFLRFTWTLPIPLDWMLIWYVVHLISLFCTTLSHFLLYLLTTYRTNSFPLKRILRNLLIITIFLLFFLNNLPSRFLLFPMKNMISNSTLKEIIQPSLSTLNPPLPMIFLLLLQYL